jgi:hypothetical protein
VENIKADVTVEKSYNKVTDWESVERTCSLSLFYHNIIFFIVLRTQI